MAELKEYIVLAYSATLNQTQRELNLMGPAPSNARNAQQWADSFAARLNQKQTLRATDWVGRVDVVNPLSHVRTQ